MINHHPDCIHRSGAVPATFPCPCEDWHEAVRSKEAMEATFQQVHGCHVSWVQKASDETRRALEAEHEALLLRKRVKELEDLHERGWQWRPVGDGAFAPPFGTVRVCTGCGCLVAGGPVTCGRCAGSEEAKPHIAPVPGE